MKYFIPKDKKHRKFTSLLEKKIFLLKSLANNTLNPNKTCISANHAIHKMRAFASSSKIRNRCFFTGRAGGVYRSFHLSRAIISRFSGFGRLSGVKNSSW